MSVPLVRLERLRCEYRENPLGLDLASPQDIYTPLPTFLRQENYRTVFAASSGLHRIVTAVTKQDANAML